LLLEANWKLHDFAPGDGLKVGAQAPEHPEHEWLPTAVPGDVHRTLINAGRIADPFYGTNASACVSYRCYAEDNGRFISEFGMHAAPVAETLWSVIPPEDRYHHSPTLDWHNKDNPKTKAITCCFRAPGCRRILSSTFCSARSPRPRG
jgi:hypothetical protein